jgi:hypothetical protein
VKLIHESGAHTLTHEGEEHKADDNGIFDVPAELGAQLVGRAGFSEWTGVRTAAQERDRIAELEAQVAELTRAVLRQGAGDAPKGKAKATA